VEYLFPYEHDPETLKGLLERHNLQQVLFNLPAGDWQAGDRGIAANPDRVEEFRQGVDRAIEYARALDVLRVNCLAGKQLESASYDEQWRTLVENVRFAATRLAQEGKTLVVEPINTFDMPGFFLCSTADGLRLIEEVGATNIKLQYDVYHMQKMEGNLTETLKAHLGQIGHIQIADNPGRHQPGTGEINYGFLLRELDSMGYDGFVGLEYNPQPDTVTSLGWITKMGFSL
jgi:hydroxypyruvate isomerase